MVGADQRAHEHQELDEVVHRVSSLLADSDRDDVASVRPRGGLGSPIDEFYLAKGLTWLFGTAAGRAVWCNLYNVITEPGTIDDLVADAAASGYEASARLIRDWTEHGLLDYPQKRPAGKGHGSAPALYSAAQRNLLLTLLHHRPGKSIASLARIPVSIWMYWGEEYVPLRQAYRALLRTLGDPQSRAYARDAARAGKDRSRAVAREVLSQMDSPQATPRARRELLDALAEAAYTGRPDFERLERAVSAVFDAGATLVRRAIGHPSAPVTTEALVASVRARLAAVEALTAGRVTGEALARARDAHLFAYADYIARYPVLAAAAPPGVPKLYAPVTADDTVSNCCRHLTFALGMELMYPEQAERMHQARAYMHRPGLAAFGLTEAGIRRQQDAR